MLRQKIFQVRDKEEHQLGLQDTQLARSAARAVTEREVARLEGDHKRLLKAETLRLTLETEQKRSELLVDERRRLLDLEHERVRISAVNDESVKLYNHREGPYEGLLLVESAYYHFHIV